MEEINLEACLVTVLGLGLGLGLGLLVEEIILEAF